MILNAPSWKGFLELTRRLSLGLSVALLFLGLLSVQAQNDTIRERLKETVQNRKKGNVEVEQREIAGLKVAIWRPYELPAPLIIFSHGFHGSNMQSVFLMEAFAEAGYLVMAPNHKDAGISASRPDEKFVIASAWNETTYKNRGDDIALLLDTLRGDRTGIRRSTGRAWPCAAIRSGATPSSAWAERGPAGKFPASRPSSLSRPIANLSSLKETSAA